MGVNWKEVDPTDFEKITRELLTREFNTQLESFAVGRDDGIDLRADNGTTIIQCKRITTNFNSLLSKLREEAKKEDVRKAKRYIVATCLELTPKNKEQILTIFPNIHSTEDILGGGELEELVGKYEEVRKLYPVLWLGDIQLITDNLRKVIDKPIDEASAYEMGKIHDVLHYISVPVEAKDALRILKENKALIITGKPGIGKTTLARYLVGYLCTFFKYELVYIESNIRDAYQKIDNTKNQIFLYDDFLGTTFINDRLEKNEEKRIDHFIEHIQSSKNKLIVFTTREYIYQQACNIYSVFNDAAKFRKLIINIEKKDTLYKASIFYKHLKRCNVPFEYIKSLFFNDSGKIWGKGCYLEQILLNDNYNPRAVAKSASSSISITRPEEFPAHILRSINNPNWIYEQAFESQLNYSQKATLIVLGSFPERTNKDTLCQAWISYLGQTYNPTMSFEGTLRILDGDFITSSQDYNRNTLLDYINPGVRDFIHDYFVSNTSVLTALISSTCFPQQISHIMKMLKQKDADLYELLKECIYEQAIAIIDKKCSTLSTTWHDVELASTLSKQPRFVKYFPIFKKILICESERNFCDVDESTMPFYYSLIIDLHNHGYTVDCIPQLIDSAMSNSSSAEVFDLFEELSNMIDDSSINPATAPKGAEDWIENYDNYLSDSDKDFLEQEEYTIESLYKAYPQGCYGICFDGILERIRELIARKEEEELEKDPGDFDDYDPDRYYGSGSANHSRNRSEERTSLEPAVVDMFIRYSDS